MMKKITLIVVLFIFASTSTFAQKKRHHKDKIRTYKIAYLTEQLDFTETEAERFWPIYNIYDKKMYELRVEGKFKLKKQIREAGGVEALNDKQAKEIALKMIAIDKEMYKATNDFYTKLPSVLSYKKIIMLEITEREFHRKLLRRYRGKRLKE